MLGFLLHPINPYVRNHVRFSFSVCGTFYEDQIVRGCRRRNPLYTLSEEREIQLILSHSFLRRFDEPSIIANVGILLRNLPYPRTFGRQIPFNRLSLGIKGGEFDDGGLCTKQLCAGISTLPHQSLGTESRSFQLFSVRDSLRDSTIVRGCWVTKPSL